MDRSVTRWATLRSASLTVRKSTGETPWAAAALAELVPLTGDYLEQRFGRDGLVQQCN